MTKNEIFMKHATKFKGEYIMTEPSAMAAMEEYAQQQVKNLNIPAVMRSLPSVQELREISKDRPNTFMNGALYIIASLSNVAMRHNYEIGSKQK